MGGGNGSSLLHNVAVQYLELLPYNHSLVIVVAVNFISHNSGDVRVAIHIKVCCMKSDGHHLMQLFGHYVFTARNKPKFVVVVMKVVAMCDKLPALAAGSELAC